MDEGKLKWATWLLIGLASIVGLITLTAMGIVPPEPLLVITATVVTAIFEEKKYAALDKSWQDWYHEQIMEYKLGEPSDNVDVTQSPRMF